MNYWDKSVFWSGYPLYDWREYVYLRHKYGAEGVFPSLEEKVCWEGEKAKSGKGWIERYWEGRRRKFLGILV
jgi:hypothetical protein